MAACARRTYRQSPLGNRPQETTRPSSRSFVTFPPPPLHRPWWMEAVGRIACKRGGMFVKHIFIYKNIYECIYIYTLYIIGLTNRVRESRPLYTRRGGIVARGVIGGKEVRRWLAECIDYYMLVYRVHTIRVWYDTWLNVCAVALTDVLVTLSARTTTTTILLIALYVRNFFLKLFVREWIYVLFTSTANNTGLYNDVSYRKRCSIVAVDSLRPSFWRTNVLYTIKYGNSGISDVERKNQTRWRVSRTIRKTTNDRSPTTAG